MSSGRYHARVATRPDPLEMSFQALVFEPALRKSEKRIEASHEGTKQLFPCCVGQGSSAESGNLGHWGGPGL